MSRCFIVLSLLFDVGCATVGVKRLNSAPLKAEGCDLKVFTSEQEIGRPYELLCLLDAKTAGPNAEVIDRMRPEACKCGADAILFLDGHSEIGRAIRLAK